jgi:hypothetical protein
MERPADEDAGQPGKLKTWWHPLLANCLRWQLGDHYQLLEEVPVGQKPLQVDVILVRKKDGELPEEARRTLAGLAEYFNDLTLLEYKSPTSTLRKGNFQTFLSYALLYRAQNEPHLAPERLHLVVMAPRLTNPFREEMRLLRVTPREEETGIWSMEVLGHRMWVLETEILAAIEHPLWFAFSRLMLSAGPTPRFQNGYAACVNSVVAWRRNGLPGRLTMYSASRSSSLSKAARNCRMASAPSGLSQNFSVPFTR